MRSRFLATLSVALFVVGVSGQVEFPLTSGTLPTIVSAANTYGGRIQFANDYANDVVLDIKGGIELIGNGHRLDFVGLSDEDCLKLSDEAHLSVNNLLIRGETSTNVCAIVGRGNVFLGAGSRIEGFDAGAIRLRGNGVGTIEENAKVSDVKLFENSRLRIKGGEVFRVVLSASSKVIFEKGIVKEIVLYDDSILELRSTNVVTGIKVASPSARIALGDLPGLGVGSVVTLAYAACNAAASGTIDCPYGLSVTVNQMDERIGINRVELVFVLDPAASLARPKVESMAISEGVLAITIENPIRGVSYELLATQELSIGDEGWRTVAIQKVTGDGPLSFKIAIVGDKRFFKIRTLSGGDS